MKLAALLLPTAFAIAIAQAQAPAPAAKPVGNMKELMID